MRIPLPAHWLAPPSSKLTDRLARAEKLFYDGRISEGLFRHVEAAELRQARSQVQRSLIAERMIAARKFGPRVGSARAGREGKCLSAGSVLRTFARIDRQLTAWAGGVHLEKAG